jgi:hypothetical protein
MSVRGFVISTEGRNPVFLGLRIEMTLQNSLRGRGGARKQTAKSKKLILI